MPILLARLAPLLVVVALSAAAGDAMAQRGPAGNGHRASSPPRAQPRPEARPRDQDALSEAVRRVERRSQGGQVLSAERVPFDGRDVSRIKVVDSSGRIRVYMDDPRDGQRDGDRDQRRSRDDDN
ncbi:hypothetical protein [Montanilutibacter psychrotolerans]|uniref:PepSY domain-containing protein n=1 Tax=Montanilutibacter psychrotolerans TaxID=1327343 RepID=A0A3M8ST31_9GAMM|nr:hypothetical protein [Lysobacter psychrotolerans]RNF82020.1 hypothetical protein EER27_15325 [Lysobacter psychrotolerans]